MKLRSLFASILASVALIGCVQEDFPALSNIEVTPSYFTLGVEGGTKEVKVISSAAWEITDTIPSWVTVSALKGNGSAEGEAVTVTVEASTDTLARAAYLKFTSGGETQLVTVNQDAFIPDFPEFKGGDYWIVFEKGAALPLSSAYGYLYTAPVKEGEDGSITGAANNIFTIKAVEGGFTIQDPAGQYYCMQGTYDSFNVYAELPETGGVWTIKQTGKTAFEVANAANGKILQYDPNYSSAGAYSSERGIYPNLVKVEVVPEPEPLGESMEIKDALEFVPDLVVEGLVTASCKNGVILTDKSGSILVYKIDSNVAVGDSIKVQGNLDIYNKGYQLINPHQYEYVDSVKKTVTYPEPVALDATTIGALIGKTAFLAQYSSVKGIVSLDENGNALVSVGDYVVGTYYSADSYETYKDKAVELQGYVTAYKSSDKRLSLVVTSVKLLENWVPETPKEPDFVAGDYWIVANDNVFANSFPEGSSYGYLKTSDAGYADNVFTFTATDGGYTIQQADGRYLYMEKEYNSFSASAPLPESGYVWSVALNQDGTFSVKNLEKEKTLQYDSNYSSYGAYPDTQGAFPKLVKAESAGERPVLELSNTTASVAADATSYGFTITSNLDWELTPCEHVTFSKVSGNGTVTVVANFPANTTSEEVTHTIELTTTVAGVEAQTLTIKQAAAGVKSAVFTFDGSEGQKETITKPVEGITLTVIKGTHTSASPYDHSNGHLRFYGTDSMSNEMTFGGGTMTSIEFEMVSGNVGTLAADSGTVTTNGTNVTWKGEAESVKFTTTTQARITKITVSYK